MKLIVPSERRQLLGVHSTGRLEQDIFVGWSARRKKVKRPDSLYPISRLAGPIPKSVGRRYCLEKNIEQTVSDRWSSCS